MEKAELAIEI